MTETAAQLRAGYYLAHIEDLNALVRAVEALEIPEPIEVPDWDKSPDDLECRGEEKRTPAEMQKIGLEWQVYATELHNKLEAAAAPGCYGDLPNVLEELHRLAEQAREALIAVGGLT